MQMMGTCQGRGTLADVVDALAHDVSVQGLEPELGAPRRQWLNDSRHIVADEHKTCHVCMGFHGAPQSILRILHICKPTRLLLLCGDY